MHVSPIPSWKDSKVSERGNRVYCDFSYSPLDANELEGCGSTGLTFNLNYRRPSFFAFETMPVVEAFCKHFNLVIEDPQQETVQPVDATRLIASWRAHNAKAMSAIREVTKEEAMDLHYLPAERATDWWRYSSGKGSKTLLPRMSSSHP
jgi:hypothetical protein